MKEYYVYAHLNPKTKEVFYIGIGFNNRAWNLKAGRNKFWDNYFNKHGCEVEILENNLTREEAGIIEKNLISFLGRRHLNEGGILVNISEGGDGGNRGYTHTEEWKVNHSLKTKGKKKKPHSDESKKKISENLLKAEKRGREGRKVAQYDKEGNLIKIWDHMKQAKRATGAKNIFEVASGYKNQRYKSSGGFIWKYV